MASLCLNTFSKGSSFINRYFQAAVTLQIACCFWHMTYLFRFWRASCFFKFHSIKLNMCDSLKFLHEKWFPNLLPSWFLGYTLLRCFQICSNSLERIPRSAWKAETFFSALLDSMTMISHTYSCRLKFNFCVLTRRTIL